MACHIPSHRNINARFRALEAEVARIAPLEAEVAQIAPLKAEVARLAPLEAEVASLKAKVTPLEVAHLHLCARSLLVAELVLISEETGIPVTELATKFAGFTDALEWARTNPHSTITRKAIEDAQRKADKIADKNVRRKVRLAAKGDAHPNLLGCSDEKQLLDIMDAFPVDVPIPGPGGLRTETVQVEDVLKVVKLFLSATGQHGLASRITPRRGTAAAVGASSATAAHSLYPPRPATSPCDAAWGVSSMPGTGTSSLAPAPGTAEARAALARSAASLQPLPASRWRTSVGTAHEEVPRLGPR
jgi:hypothetical protein